MNQYQNPALNFKLMIPDSWQQVEPSVRSFGGVAFKSKPRLFGVSLSLYMTVQACPADPGGMDHDAETDYFQREAARCGRKSVQTGTVDIGGANHLSAVYLASRDEALCSPAALEIIGSVRKSFKMLRGMSDAEIVDDFARHGEGVVIKNYVVRLGASLFDIHCAYSFGSVAEAMAQRTDEDAVYEHVASSLRLLRETQAAAGKAFDFFISYKSKDAPIARAVADQLIADGKRVWFAEYQILLEKRDEFQAAIDRGLAQSEYGIAITNNNYIQSEYCKYEMQNLLGKCGRNKILEVMVPRENEPHQAFPDLAAGHAVESADLSAILAGVGGMAGCSFTGIAAPPAGRAESYAGLCEGARFALDRTGWKMTQSGVSEGGNTGKGAEFQYIGTTKGPLFVNIYFGIDISPESHKRFNLPGHDDRELYNALMVYAKGHLAQFGAKIAGVHLLFHRGMSQIALTYNNSGIWMRKCSITALHPALNRPVEFVFTFGYLGEFQDYCRYTPLMDRFALSLDI